MATLLYPDQKILTPETAQAWRQALRENGKKLVLTNGCFDLLHCGHVDLLFRARALGDALLVLINSDDSVRRLKGPTRPINTAHDRAFVLAALGSVDGVFIFDSQRCDAQIRLFAPDDYVKGGDYTLESLDPSERAALLACGARIHFVPFREGYSTTSTLARV